MILNQPLFISGSWLTCGQHIFFFDCIYSVVTHSQTLKKYYSTCKEKLTFWENLEGVTSNEC